MDEGVGMVVVLTHEGKYVLVRVGDGMLRGNSID